MPYDGRTVANFLLDLGDQIGRKLTNLELLKILYFCHGWYLVKTDQKLIKNKFEMWEHGPVIRVVYDEFKPNKNNHIFDRAMIFNIESMEKAKPQEIISEDDRKFLRDIFMVYSRFSASYLRHLSHTQNSPWNKIWNTEKQKARISMAATDDEIREHFLSEDLHHSIQMYSATKDTQYLH